MGEHARREKLQRKPETESGDSHVHQVAVVFMGLRELKSILSNFVLF